LRREDFDAMEFEAAGSGDHETAARRMIKLAETGTQTESMPRSEAFLRAGEQWLLADDPAAAENGFRLAIADGGPVFVDARVPLSRALFLQDRPAEAQVLLDELKAEAPRDPRLCDLVAELLVERSDLPAALDWATAGVQLCLQRQNRGADGQAHAAAAVGRTEDSAAAPQAEANGAKSDGAKSDGAKSDGAKSDGAKSDGAKSDGAVSDGGKSDAAGKAGPDEAESELRLLLSLRYRIRNDLGLPEDEYDAMLDE
jgi:hypothetical protein